MRDEMRKELEEIRPPTLFQLKRETTAIRRMVKELESMLVSHLMEFLRNSLINDPKEMVIEKITELLKEPEISFIPFPGEMMVSYFGAALTEELLKNRTKTTLADWKEITTRLVSFMNTALRNKEESVAEEAWRVIVMIREVIERAEIDFLG